MVLLVFIAAGIGFAFATGGRIRNLERCPVRHWWLPISSALVEYCGRFLYGRQNLISQDLFVLLQYFLLFVFVLVNIKKRLVGEAFRHRHFVELSGDCL